MLSVSALNFVSLQKTYSVTPGFSRAILKKGSAVPAFGRSYASVQASAIEEVDFDPTMSNFVSLMGNVGRKPEVRYLESGKVASWSIAVTDRKDGPTHWVDVNAWNELSEVAERDIDRGQQIIVQGRLKMREWTDPNGVARKGITIVANSLKRVKRTPRMEDNDWQQQQQPSQSGQQQWGQPAAVAQQAAPAAGAQYIATAQPSSGPAVTNEELWMSFFEDTAGWYDNRPRKMAGEISAKAPDFKRKEGGREWRRPASAEREENAGWLLQLRRLTNSIHFS